LTAITFFDLALNLNQAQSGESEEGYTLQEIRNQIIVEW